MRFLSLILLTIVVSNLQAKENFFNLLGYVDTYYCTDNLDKEFDLFSSINHRRETFALNIAYLKFDYTTDNLKLTLALQEGDIPQNIYFQEPKNIQQANAKFKIYDNLWLGAGIFTTHIGWEATHPRNNFFSTHSATTFFEPTYQTGLSLNYNLSENFSFSFYLINGNHLFEDNNKNKTIATSINYKVGNLSFSYNNMFGNEEPDGKKSRLHTYHNLIIYNSINDKFELATQIDIGTLENSFGSKTGLMKSGFIQYKYKISNKINHSGRMSYFSDTQNVYNQNVEGFDATIGLEFKPYETSYIRFESRYLRNNSGSNKYAFVRNNKKTNELFELSLNIGAWFDLKF